jgi:uncharacterized protein YggE
MMAFMTRGVGILLLTGAAPAFAESPPSVSSCARLAPGEIILKVSGSGLQLSRPDIATFTVIISASGEDGAAARAAATARISKLTADLAAKDIGQTAVQMIPDAGETLGLTGNEGFLSDGMEDPDQGPVPLDPKKAVARRYATSVMQIRLTDMSKIGTVRTILEDRKGARALPPAYALLDDSSARRSAIDQALAKARESAVIYAKALNMRIKATIGVTDGANVINAQNNFLQTLNPARAQASSVRTTADVEMDIILAPL